MRNRIRGFSVLQATIFSSISLITSSAHAQVTLLTQIPVRSLVRAQSGTLKQPLRVAVQQAISALPPTAGQSFTYKESPDPVAGFRREVQLSPISFRTPAVVSPDGFTVRLAVSYFDISETLAPVAFVGTSASFPGASGAIKLGLDAQAKATIMNLSGTYGFGHGFDLSVSLPVTFVQAKARSIFTTLNDGQFLGIPNALVFEDTSPNNAIRVLDDLVAADLVVFGEANINAVGGDLETGTQVGLGRVGISFKKEILGDAPVEGQEDPGLAEVQENGDNGLTLSIAQEFSLPSPSSEALAGTDSFAALPRIIVALPLADDGRLHFDAGYEFDADLTELWRATWNAGASFWIDAGTLLPEHYSGLIDFGFGGSHYREELDWSPAAIRTDHSADGLNFQVDWVAQSATGVGGTNYVDFLAGFKIGIRDSLLLGGSVSVPITKDGLRPTAAGTLALEYHF